MSDAYIVINISTTTPDDQGVYFPKDFSEIIELAWVIVDGSTLEEKFSNHLLVRPINTPITSLCTSITALTWDHVQNARGFSEAIAALDASIQAHIPDRDIIFVGFIASEIRVQILREAFDKGVILPLYLQCPKFFDLKTEYSRWHKHHPEIPHQNPITLTSICNNLGIAAPPEKSADELGQGGDQEYSGKAAEEVVIVSRVLEGLIKHSQPIENHQDVFAHPNDLKEDMQAFMNECSNIIFLSNLPHDTTQGELESWFTQYGGRPIDFWTLQVPDQGKATGSGFVAFSTHEEAIGSFSMNGKCLNDRIIEVFPSSPSVLEHASDILVHFPQSKNRPRPGDWNCPKCGFSNFQRRTACFRCSYPLPTKNNTQSKNIMHNTTSTSTTTNNNNNNNDTSAENSDLDQEYTEEDQDLESGEYTTNLKRAHTGAAGYAGYPLGPSSKGYSGPDTHRSRSTTPKNTTGNSAHDNYGGNNNGGFAGSAIKGDDVEGYGNGGGNKKNHQYGTNGSSRANEHGNKSHLYVRTNGSGRNKGMHQNGGNDEMESGGRPNGGGGGFDSPHILGGAKSLRDHDRSGNNNNASSIINNENNKNNDKDKDKDENNSGGTQSHGNGPAVPFRAGDWKCGREGCNYHNFAKNVSCLRCGASRVSASVVSGGMGNNGGSGGNNSNGSVDHHHHNHHSHHHNHYQPQQQNHHHNNGHHHESNNGPSSCGNSRNISPSRHLGGGRGHGGNGLSGEPVSNGPQHGTGPGSGHGRTYDGDNTGRGNRGGSPLQRGEEDGRAGGSTLGTFLGGSGNGSHGQLKKTQSLHVQKQRSGGQRHTSYLSSHHYPKPRNNGQQQSAGGSRGV